MKLKNTDKQNDATIDFSLGGWDENRLSQLFDFANSSPEDKLRWLEEMHELLDKQLPNRLLADRNNS